MAGLHQCPGCGYRFETDEALLEHEPACLSDCLVCLNPECKGGCL